MQAKLDSVIITNCSTGALFCPRLCVVVTILEVSIPG